jgi:FemAB family protein
MKINIVKAKDKDFKKMWQSLRTSDPAEYPLYSFLDIDYSIEYFMGSVSEDFSFIIAGDDVPLAGVIIAGMIGQNKEKELSGFGRPVFCIENEKNENLALDEVQSLFKEELGKIIEKFKPDKIIFKNFGEKLSMPGRFLLDMGAQVSHQFINIIDLSLSEAKLKYNLRHSYRSLINWGFKNLKIEIIDYKNISEEKIEAFRKLHIEVAGKGTRSKETWQYQFEMIKNKEAFAVFGYLDGELVTAALFIYSPKYCFYGVSASKRELFDKPMSHSLLWTAVLHAKKIGCIFFETGEQFFPYHKQTTKVSDKDFGISTFKRGFGGGIFIRNNIIWTKNE